MYDPWGNVTSASGKSVKIGGEYDLMFGRGFTGHEHLPWFGLINMNARLYDPVVGRFLSPDPRLQQPNNTQNYNRYSYALNNPLKYTDPNGEFFLSPVTGFFELIVNLCKHGFNKSQYCWQRTINSWRIDMGMFKGNFGQILNKWTWGLINSAVGTTVGHVYNWVGLVDGVTDMDGMLALSGANDDGSAVTLGHISIGPEGYTATWKDHLFVHEYGHYIQSQIFGPSYLKVIGISSLLSAAHITTSLPKTKHEERWFEVQASKLGGKHFNHKYGEGRKGYVSGSEDYFDYDIYRGKKSGTTKYINPRTNYGNGSLDTHRSSSPKYSFWDIFI